MGGDSQTGICGPAEFQCSSSLSGEPDTKIGKKSNSGVIRNNFLNYYFLMYLIFRRWKTGLLYEIWIFRILCRIKMHDLCIDIKSRSAKFHFLDKLYANDKTDIFRRNRQNYPFY